MGVNIENEIYLVPDVDNGFNACHSNYVETIPPRKSGRTYGILSLHVNRSRCVHGYSDN